MMQRILQSSWLAGFASACLFVIAAYTQLGVIFLYLSALPLMAFELYQPARRSMNAILAGAIAVGLLMGIYTALFYTVIIALPAAGMTRMSRLHVITPRGVRWMPMGIIFEFLSLLACCLIVAFVAYYMDEPGGLRGVIGRLLAPKLANLDSDLQPLAGPWVSQWLFLALAMMSWLWQLTLYLMLWISHRYCREKAPTPRPNVAIRVFIPSLTLMYFLAVAALASLIGSEEMRFLGKAIFATLLFPYVLLGLGLLHHASARWPQRIFFLFMAYATLAIALWPALVLALWGVFFHIKTLVMGRK